MLEQHFSSCTMEALAAFGLAVAAFWSLWVVFGIFRSLLRQRPRGQCLKGKRVLITGASSGIGAELARQYATLGASLCLGARRLEALDEVTKECKQIHARNATGGVGARMEVFPILTDVSEQEECEELVAKAVDALGGLDIVVLNAGIGLKERFDDTTIDQHQQLFDVNYWGVVNVARFSLPHLAKAKGSLVVVSSLSGLYAGPKAAAYASSKHALHGFFDSLRYDLKAKNMEVNVTLACPGYVISSFHDNFLKENSGKRNMNKFMSTEDCCRQIIEGAYNRDRTVVMTFFGRLGLYMKLFMPYWVSDWLTERTALGAFELGKKED